MTEPQVWTLIGVFAAVMLGGMTLMTTLLSRVITASVDGLRDVVTVKFEAVDARFEAVDARFAAVDARFAAIDGRFDALTAKIDHLDRDMSAVHRRLFGIDRSED